MVIQRGTLSIPEKAGDRIPSTTTRAMDTDLGALRARAQEWIDTPIQDRIDLVADLRTQTAKHAREWVKAACLAKGIEHGSAPEGEEWQAGPWILLRNLRLLQRSLEQLATGEKPKLPGKIKKRRKGPTLVPVFPTDRWDRILFQRFKAHIQVDDGLSSEEVIERQAPAYTDPVKPSVCVILGAGNVSSIAPTDTLYKLFVEHRTVMLKVNPVNEYIGPILEKIFKAFVDRDLIRFAYGGVEVGAYLTGHELVNSIHMTGSDKTHDAIVFGSGEDGARNKAAGRAINEKHMTSELGNVTPVIVVPGPWSEKDLDYQADSLTTMLVNNAGFNCIATRVIINHESWEHRTELLDRLAASFATVTTRDAYYPGAQARYDAFTEAHPDAERSGLHSDSRLPWTMIRDVDHEQSDDICFATEAFTSILSEVGLPADDPVEFVERAVEFCNETVWGTLGATILVHPRTKGAVKRAARRAVDELRYGTVAVNQWSGVGFALMSTPWGGYPGSPITDIQSGSGFVHNTYMVENVIKAIVRGPWRVRPRPPWSPRHRRSLRAYRALTRFEERPSIWRLLPVLFWSARP